MERGAWEIITLVLCSDRATTAASQSRAWMIEVTTLWVNQVVCLKQNETVTSAPLGPLATQGTSGEAPVLVLVACCCCHQPQHDISGAFTVHHPAGPPCSAGHLFFGMTLNKLALQSNQPPFSSPLSLPPSLPFPPVASLPGCLPPSTPHLPRPGGCSGLLVQVPLPSMALSQASSAFTLASMCSASVSDTAHVPAAVCTPAAALRAVRVLRHSAPRTTHSSN